jgi:hypothetical protein
VLGRQHARQHGVVAAFDARHIDEARGAAEQRAAGEYKLRHRLVAAFADGAGAVTNPLAVRESVANERMRLETLKLFERR